MGLCIVSIVQQNYDNDNINHIGNSKRRTESSRDTNNQSFAFDCLAQIDFVAGRALDQDIKVWELFANFDKGACRAVKGSTWARDIESQSTESSGRCHCWIVQSDM